MVSRHGTPRTGAEEDALVKRLTQRPRSLGALRLGWIARLPMTHGWLWLLGKVVT